MDDVIMARRLDYKQTIEVVAELKKISVKGYRKRLEKWFSITDCVTIWINDTIQLAAVLRTPVVQLDEFDNPTLGEPIRLFDCISPNPSRTDIDFLRTDQQRIYSVLPRNHEEFLIFFSWMNESNQAQVSVGNWMKQVDRFKDLTDSYWQRISTAPSPKHLLSAELVRIGKPALAGLETNLAMPPIHRWNSVPWGVQSFETEGMQAEELQLPLESILSQNQAFAPRYRYFCPADINDLGYLLATVELGRIKARYAAFLSQQSTRHEEGKDLRLVEDFDDSSVSWITIKKRPRAHHWAYFIRTMAEKGWIEGKDGNKIKKGENNWKQKAYEVYKDKMTGISFDTFDFLVRRDKCSLVKDGEDALVILMIFEKESPHLNAFYRGISI